MTSDKETVPFLDLSFLVGQRSTVPPGPRVLGECRDPGPRTPRAPGRPGTHQ